MANGGASYRRHHGMVPWPWPCKDGPCPWGWDDNYGGVPAITETTTMTNNANNPSFTPTNPLSALRCALDSIADACWNERMDQVKALLTGTVEGTAGRRALAALFEAADLALTGKTCTQGYEHVVRALIEDGAVLWYLSDGGYSRLRIDLYEGGAAVLALTLDSRHEVKDKWQAMHGGHYHVVEEQPEPEPEPTATMTDTLKQTPAQTYMDELLTYLTSLPGEAKHKPYMPTDTEALRDLMAYIPVTIAMHTNQEPELAQAYAQVLVEVAENIARLLGESLPPVELGSLLNGGRGSGFKDRVFGHAVGEFMAEHMNGFDPTTLFTDDTNPWTDATEWEFEIPTRFKVIEVTLTARYHPEEAEVDEDGTVDMTTGWVVGIDFDTSIGTNRDEVALVCGACDTLEGTLTYDAMGCGEHEDGDTETVYLLFDHGYGNFADDVYDDEDDAKAEADERNDDAFHESLLAVPWAWNWSWCPDSCIRTEDLLDSGFNVGAFRGTRYAGIDGSGMDFTSSFFAELYVRVMARWGRLCPTERGPRYVKM